jgi:hypothetical protein
MKMKPAGVLNGLAGYAFVAAAASKVFGIPFRGVVDVPVLAVHRVGDRGYPTKRLIMKLAAGDPNSISVRKVASMVEWDRVREWNSFCKTHHRNICVRRHLSPLPGLRVIDCKTRKIIKIRNPSIEYVALSYVWGVGEAAPDEDLRIPSELPPTIEDAIQAVLRLGYYYLWIDRYCVPQSDSEEKSRLIQNMGDVYENSVFNIIAAAGDGPHHGLPGVTHPRSAQPEARIGTHLLVSTLSDVKECVDESKWNSRGWTYQEALLSRRKVVFTPTQVYFQCAAMHCQESLQVPLRQLHTNNLQEFRFNIQLPKAFPARGLGRLPWDIFDRISEYSRRDLSYNGDALRAFQGILNGFERMKTSVANFHGVVVLPTAAIRTKHVTDTERLLFGLCWYVAGPCKRRLVFPSWMWAEWSFQPGSRLCQPYAFKRGQTDAPFVGCARVAFEYGGSDSAPNVLCDDNLDRILTRSRLEQTPPLVRLQGRTCDVTARAKRGEHHLTVDGLETPLSIQGDLQIPLSQDAILKGVVLGYSLKEGHVEQWMLLTVKNSQMCFERVGVATISSDATSEATDHAVDIPFTTADEEIMLN